MSNRNQTSAFPLPEIRNENGALVQYAEPGMTYRQWLVGMALQAILSNSAYMSNTGGQKARAAVAIADHAIEAEEEGR